MIGTLDTTKEFKTLQAEFALRGHTFARTDSADETVSYFASRWGMSRYLPDLDAAKRFLDQIGGVNA